ncbi:hypothetical protein [Luteimonas vadosa]|uniref:Uncharacterized protein n=1 Tax=Luteimonas vadosa TaxID=1165507 RepID=A0ABP9DU87_9GAMM
MTTSEPAATAKTRVLGALALELTPGSEVARDALSQREAGALAALVARDLATHDADAARLQLATVAAHYDPVELLRPGWPLHEALRQLAARAPGGRQGDDGRIVAFGTHEGRMPGTLSPAPEFAGGPLRLVPFVLDGDAATVARVATAFESALMERGMAAADTALAMQEAFGLRIEHARYLTLHDLCAMTALQYEHAGLAPLWPILETALLAPGREAWLDAPPEPLLRYVDGEARIALFPVDRWRRRYAGDSDGDAATLERSHARFEARQRQFASVLQAHAVPVTFAHCSGDASQDL